MARPGASEAPTPTNFEGGDSVPTAGVYPSLCEFRYRAPGKIRLLDKRRFFAHQPVSHPEAVVGVNYQATAMLSAAGDA